MLSFDHITLAGAPQAFVMPMGYTWFVTEALRAAGIEFACSCVCPVRLGEVPDAEEWDALRDRCSKALGCGDLHRNASLVVISSRVPNDILTERVRTLFEEPLDRDIRAYYRALAACGFDLVHTPQAEQIADPEFCRKEAYRQCRGPISAWLEKAQNQQVRVFSTLLDPNLYGDEGWRVVNRALRREADGRYVVCETSHVCIAVRAKKGMMRAVAKVLDCWPDAYAPLARPLGVLHEGFAATFKGLVSDRDMWGASYEREVPPCYREADRLAQVLNAKGSESELFTGYLTFCDALVVNALRVRYDPIDCLELFLDPTDEMADMVSGIANSALASIMREDGRAFSCLAKVTLQFDRLRSADGPHACGLIDTFGALAMLFEQCGMVEEAHGMRLSTLDEVSRRADEGAWLGQVAPHLALLALDLEPDALGSVTGGMLMRLAERLAAVAYEQTKRHLDAARLLHAAGNLALWSACGALAGGLDRSCEDVRPVPEVLGASVRWLRQSRELYLEYGERCRHLECAEELPRVTLSLGRALERLGDTAAARVLFFEATRRWDAYAMDGSSVHSYGAAYSYAQLATALRCLRLSLDPSAAERRMALARQEAGMRDRLASLWRSTADLALSRARSYAELADECYLAGMLPEAERAYERAQEVCEEAGEESDAYWHRAHLLFWRSFMQAEQGDAARAHGLWAAAVKALIELRESPWGEGEYLEVDEPMAASAFEAYATYLELLLEGDRFTEALEAYDEANRALGYFEVAMPYLPAGYAQSVLASFRRALDRVDDEELALRFRTVIGRMEFECPDGRAIAPSREHCRRSW